MFFIGVFGMQDKQKEIGIIKNLSCKNCSGIASRLNLYKTYAYFHIFFLPVFKWNERYCAVCSSCNSIYEIPKEKGIRAEHGDEEAITYWDLKPIDSGSYNNYIKYRCKNCGKDVEPQFEYCPYCGTKRD